MDFDKEKSVLSIEDNPQYMEGFFASSISDIIGIVGENGAGKTTFLNYLQIFMTESPYMLPDLRNDILIYLKKEENELVFYHNEEFPIKIMCSEAFRSKFKVTMLEYARKSENDFGPFAKGKHARRFQEDFTSHRIIHFSNVFDSGYSNLQTDDIIDISTNALINTDIESYGGQHGVDRAPIDKLEAYRRSEASRELNFLLDLDSFEGPESFPIPAKVTLLCDHELKFRFGANYNSRSDKDVEDAGFLAHSVYSLNEDDIGESAKALMDQFFSRTEKIEDRFSIEYLLTHSEFLLDLWEINENESPKLETLRLVSTGQLLSAFELSLYGYLEFRVEKDSPLLDWSPTERFFVHLIRSYLYNVAMFLLSQQPRSPQLAALSVYITNALLRILTDVRNFKPNIVHDIFAQSEDRLGSQLGFRSDRFTQSSAYLVELFEILRKESDLVVAIYQAVDIPVKKKETVRRISDLVVQGIPVHPLPIAHFGLPGLSSGEVAFLKLFGRFYSLSSSIKWRDDIKRAKNLLISIDEGELYFHPNWQRQFVSFVVSILPQIFEKKNLQILVTSHSPIITSDLPRNNLVQIKKRQNPERDNLNVRGSGHTSVVPNSEESFAANIHLLYSNTFFLGDGLIGAFADRKLRELIDEVTSEDRDQANVELRHRIEQVGEKYLQIKLLEILERDDSNS